MYDILERRGIKNDYVDGIANAYCDADINPNKLKVYARANDILQEEYGIDVLSYPFRNEDLKQDIENYIMEQKNIDISI